MNSLGPNQNPFRMCCSSWSLPTPRIPQGVREIFNRISDAARQCFATCVSVETEEEQGEEQRVVRTYNPPERSNPDQLETSEVNEEVEGGGSANRDPRQIEGGGSPVNDPKGKGKSDAPVTVEFVIKSLKNEGFVSSSEEFGATLASLDGSEKTKEKSSGEITESEAEGNEEVEFSEQEAQPEQEVQSEKKEEKEKEFCEGEEVGEEVSPISSENTLQELSGASSSTHSVTLRKEDSTTVKVQCYVLIFLVSIYEENLSQEMDKQKFKKKLNRMIEKIEVHSFATLTKAIEIVGAIAQGRFNENSDFSQKTVEKEEWQELADQCKKLFDRFKNIEDETEKEVVEIKDFALISRENTERILQWAGEDDQHRDQ